MPTAPPRQRPVRASLPALGRSLGRSPGRPAPPAPPMRAGEFRNRLKLGRILLVTALALTTVRLVVIQTAEADDLRSASARQVKTDMLLPAERGEILDRNGKPLAFSVEAKALVTNPRTIARTHPDDRDAYITRMATAVAQATGQNEQDLRALLTKDAGYVVLAKLVDPAVARDLQKQFVEIAAEAREDRQYPDGAMAANLVGSARWDADGEKLTGSVGLEASQDNVLSGSNGVRSVDTAEGSDTVIPGSTRFERAAVQGATITLTVDSDLQYMLQKSLSDYVAKTGAKLTSSAVVLDARTGQVLALANGGTFDPTNLGAADPAAVGIPAVTTPFEPGSVNKVVTMAAALESGVAKPDDVLDVPGSIKVADRTVNDAWKHGLDHYTLTGVLAKSSNVGTIMTAQKVGPDRFSDMLAKMGIGTRTDVGLAGESAGRVPPRNTWSGSTFGNLPIGQGLSMTVLQMAGMYQAVANNGLRIPPRIIASTTGPDGTVTPTPAPAGVQVVSPQTAATLRTMLMAVTQKAPKQSGTGFTAAVPGYEVAGKTGTAQQVDPTCGCYSASTYWITFAGMMPAQDPRFVIGIMLDAPQGGTSAAPLFHDVAAYIAQRDRIPVSAEPQPVQTLVAP